MKAIHTFIATLLFSAIALSGNSKDALFDYVNEIFEPVPQEQAAYQRKAVVDEDGLYRVEILFLDGTKRMTGTYTNEYFETEEGWFEYYFYAGHKESEGLFEGGRKVGVWKRWDWTGKSLKDRQYATPVSDQPIRENSRSAFPGGEEALLRYIDSQLNASSASGEVRGGDYAEVCFTIDILGQPKNIQVLKSNNTFLAAEAIHLVQSMPTWTPAMKNGLPVESLFILPVAKDRAEVIGKF